MELAWRSAAARMQKQETGSPLSRALGPFGLTFSSIGLIVGAGIYSVIGAAAGKAGEGLWQSFLLGAVVALLTAFSYAELATAFPRAGAEYTYVCQAFPKQRWASFLIGFVLTLAAAATAATVALAFADYSRPYAPVPRELIALGLLIACTALNLIGISQSSWVNIVFTTVEVLGLILFIGVGMSEPRFGEGAFEPPDAGILAGAALIFFVYLGFEEVANLAEEAKEPERDVPRAIFWSLGITTVLYVLVGLAAVTLAPPERLAESDSPLAHAVSPVSPQIAGILRGVALFSTANTALLTLIASSRMLFGMARDKSMPETLARVLPGRKTPWVAAVTVAVWACVLIPLGGLEIVAGLASFASLLAFAAVNVALIVLRYRQPDRERPFRVPGAIGRVPIPALLGVLAIAPLLFQFEKQTYLAGAIALVLGLGLFAFMRRSMTGRRCSESAE